MNEEEKQAVKDFEDLLKKHFEETSVTSFNFLDGVEGIHILNIIKKQQKEIEQTKTKINKIVLMIRENYDSDFYDDYETISALRDDIYNLLTKNIGE